MQFPYIPETIQNVIPEQGWLSVPLTDANIEDIRKFIQIGIQQLRSPSPVSQLHFQSIMTRLCIIVMEALELDQMSPVANHARQTVGKAIEWYEENLRHAPTLEDVARNVSVSPAHMRRMFHQALDLSPKEALDQLRFRKAHELLENQRYTVEAIAELTGFYSASAFSRAFKNRIGVSPKEWRTQLGKGTLLREV
jgi:AraC-like DNA-binding protein